MALKTTALLLVPLLGLVELSAHLFFSGRAPRIQEWVGARSVVQELRKKDELIVIAPLWAEPNARHAFGDFLMPLAHVARADVTPFRRAIEVSILGNDAPELEGWRIVSEREEGKFRFRILENPKPSKVVYDFVDRLPEAVVADKTGGAVEPCRYDTRARRDAGGLHGHPAFPAARHVCSGADFHFAGVTVVEDEQWRPRRCIWAHPIGNKTLSLEYADVPLGTVIRGYATLPWWLERERRGQPVKLDVLVDEQPIGGYVHVDGDGWKPFSFRSPGTPGRRARVEFRISSPGAKDRQFCFVADTR